MARPSATIDLRGDDTDLKRALAGGLRRVKAYADNVGRALRNVARKAAIVVPAAGLAILTKSIALAREQIQAEKKLEAVIRATGGAAGFTANELKKMAADLQKVTNFGDEVTISAMAVLATFKEIKGDQFREAIKSAQDMSSVLGTDLKGSVLQLGKALNDPITGISALSRAGVSFTVEQKELIRTLQESGDIMGAQKIILAELASEFGGAAEEMADPFAQLANDVGDLGEALGNLAMPTLLRDIKAAQEAIEGLQIFALRFERAALKRSDPEGNKEEVDRLANQIRALEGQGRDDEEILKGRQEQATRRIAFELANPGREPPTETELQAFEAEQRLVDTRIASEEAAADLAAAEERIFNARQTASPRELLDLNELEFARRNNAAATEDLTKAENEAVKAREKAAEVTRKRLEGIDAFEERLRGVEDNRGLSADQIALDKLLVNPLRREELQGIIDKNQQKQEQRDLDERGEDLEKRVATPFEKLKETLAGFGDLFAAGSIDQETFDRATAAARDAFQEDIPDLGPSAADELSVEDRGFQARFEGITEISNRIAAAAASRDPGDQALKAAERTATATEDSASKLADFDRHRQEQNGILIEIRDKPPVPAVAG